MTATTYKLAKMNLVVRGLSAHLGGVPAEAFFKDQHSDMKSDYIMANPPFKLRDWRDPDELTSDRRWSRFTGGVTLTVKSDRFALFPSANLDSAN